MTDTPHRQPKRAPEMGVHAIVVCDHETHGPTTLDPALVPRHERHLVLTPEQHQAQHDWVVASLLVDDARETHHTIYPRRKVPELVPGESLAAAVANLATRPVDPTQEARP